MADNSSISEYYKVSFITTRSKNIPASLKYTGGLIIASDLDMLPHPKSLWFRGNLIASGYGFPTAYAMEQVNSIGTFFNEILGGPDNVGYKAFISTYSWYDEDGVQHYGESIYDRVMSTYAWTNNVYAYVRDAYSYSLEFTYNTYSYVQSSYNKLYDSVSYALDHVTDDLEKTKTYSYAYTRNWVTKIIGGAPDVLDSLAEISYWLKQNQELGMSTVDTIMKIENSYMSHGEPVTYYTGNTYQDANGVTQRESATYTLLSTYSTYTYFDKNLAPENYDITYNVSTYTYFVDYVIANDGSYIYDPTQFGDKQIFQKPETGSYISYIPQTYILGINAVRDTQVLTTFENHNLEDILKCLIEPYPYKIPHIQITSINDIALETFNTTYVEPNTTVSINTIQGYAYLEDAIMLESASVPTNTYISSSTSTSFNIKESGSVLMTPGTTINAGLDAGDITVINSLNMTYGYANPQPYPQLKSLVPVVYDYDNRYKPGTDTSSTDNVILKVRYNAFWACGNTDNGFSAPIDDASMKNGNSVPIDSLELPVEFKSDSDLLWIGLPIGDNKYQYLIDEIWLTDTKTNLSQNLYKTMSKSDVMKYGFTNATISHNNIDYKIYTIENKEFLMASDYDVKIKLIQYING